jgi:hypothetical protein
MPSAFRATATQESGTAENEYFYHPSPVGVQYGTVLSLVIRDRGRLSAGSARAERQLQHLPAATAAAAVVVRPSRRRVLKCLQALPLQALHLALRILYEAGPSATYDVPAWASGRPSRVVFSSAAGLVITATDG